MAGGPRGKGDVAQLIRDHLRPGQTAVDVGAALGAMSEVMAQCVGPTGHVVAIEADPSPMKVDKLAAVCQRYPMIQPVWTALGEAEGAVVPLQRAGTTAASRWHGDGTRIQVPMTTLDAVAPARVDLVKMDVQGSEGHVLDGAARVLAMCPVWILELWPWGLSTAGRSALDVVQQLRAAGLTVYWPKGTDPIQDADLVAWAGTVGAPSGEMANIVAKRHDGHTNIVATR